MTSLLHGQQVTPDRRDEWLEARKSRIGASEIASCIGINQYDSQLRIWLTKTGKLPPKEVTPEMEVGSVLEPAILELYQIRTKKTITQTQMFFVSHEHDFLCATLDGITSDGINVQAKNVGCQSAIQWGLDGTDDVPHHVLLQVQQEMLCSGLNLTHVVALIGGNDLRVYEVCRDDMIIHRMVYLGRQFIEKVRTQVYPEPNHGKDHELIKYLFPSCAGSIAFDEYQTDTVRKWEDISFQLKQLESNQKECKKEILMAIGDHSQATLTDGRVLTRSITVVPERTQTVKEYSFPVLRIKLP